VTRLARVAVAALCTTVCGGSTPTPGSARVRLTASGLADTVQFTVPVSARRCAPDGGALLVIGADHGQGVLVWLRDGTAEPAPGTYPLLARADSTATRGAIVSVRFVTGPLAHGVTVDDGNAILSRSGSRLGIVVRGRGTEPSPPIPHSAELDLTGVPLESDTASCRVTR
jgi:hypothetical protein